MDEIERKYPALTERICGYPMPEAARASILAQVEAIYRQERGRWRAGLVGYLLGREPRNELP